MIDLDEMTEEQILEYLDDLSEEELNELRLNFDADDANNSVNAKKMIAHLKKRGIPASHEGGSLHRAVVKVDPSINASQKAYIRNKVKKRYDVDVQEAAIDTLRPGGAPGETKAQTLDTFVQLLAQLGKEDLSDLFNQVQAQYGPGQAPGAVDNSQNNAATVAMKPSAAVGTGAWKEDLDNLFIGDDLTEELKEKTQVVFEAAVNTRASLVEARLEEQFEEAVEALEEEYNEKLQEQANEIFESVTDKLDQYLDYVIEKWMTENEIAVESGIRVQIAEDFMDSLHNVFTEHYITIPESKLDIVADLKEQVEELSEKLNMVLDEKIHLESVNKEFTKSQIIEDLSEDLAETQVDKLSTLAEGLEYTNPDNFKRKVSILKERYFGTLSKTTGLITEVIDGTVDEESATTGFTTPEMRAYAQAISKSVK